jgi:hypothetical protein
MPAINSTQSLVGFFKEVYAQEVKDLTAPILKVSNKIKFTEATMVGNRYHAPVDVAMEHGVTAAAANAGAPVTLIQPVAGVLQDAQVEGAQIFGRAQVDYESIYRAAQAGPKAFGSATKHIVKRLATSVAKRLEISMLHGQRGIGAITAQSGAATSRTWTISDESWASGIWAGSVNATLDVWNAALSSKLNTTGAAGSLYITSVNVNSKQVSVTGNATDLSAIDTEIATNGSANIFWETFSPTTEMAGLDKITRNTGTLFNINAAVYETWAGNIYSTSTGTVSMGKLLEALATPVAFGAEGDYVAVVSPKAFEVLNADLAALRMLDQSYGKKGVNGFGSITYYYQNGSLEIMAHPLQKDGLAHLFNPSEAKRIGATDLTFISRRGTEEALILELANSAGAEMRCYVNQALFIEAPRRTSVLAGITYA